MSQRPKIGITSGEIYNKDHPWSPYVLGQSHTYVNAIIDAGGLPIILPVSGDADVVDQLYELCDGILFAGGNDISPDLYGEAENGAKNTSRARDDFELQLMKRALQDKKPLLGICRGMQLMNIARGGTIYQDIVSQVSGAQSHDSSNEAQSIEHIAHHLRVVSGTDFARIIGAETVKSNSHHHQAIHKLGDSIKVNAFAEDGIIEGVEIVGDQFAIGVQSHPESMYQRVEPLWCGFFSALIHEAGNSK